MAHFFCEKCGAEVSRQANQCPSCGTRFSGVQCPSCGFSGSPGEFWEGCPVCGYLTPEQRHPEEFRYFASEPVGEKKARGRKKSGPNPLLLLTGLGILLGIFILFYFLFL